MPKTGKLREWWGIILIAAGIAGTLLPVIPGFVLIAAGVAILGPNHYIVRRSRKWLEKKGVLKPEATTSGENDPLEPCAPSSTGVGSSKIDEEALKK